MKIIGSMATLYGYQYNSRTRVRIFTVCLTANEIILNNGVGDDYCEVPPGSEFKLHLKQVSDGVLSCRDCEVEDFPPYWIRDDSIKAKPGLWP